MLRRRLEAVPEVLQDFDLAAEQKYWEGLELLLAGHRAGSIYVLGYEAEMILKYACFRALGHRPGTAVAGLFGPAKKWMQIRRPMIRSEGYHSLWFWMHNLRATRRTLGNPMPIATDVEIVRRIRRLYQIWWVEMRYRPDRAHAGEVLTVFDDVSWLRANRIQLWS
jgi:hypothetical protein